MLGFYHGIDHNQFSFDYTISLEDFCPLPVIITVASLPLGELRSNWNERYE